MISESALHAYADGELADNLRQDVENWLADNPEDVERISEWKMQGEDLRALYGAALTEKVPTDLKQMVRRFPGSRLSRSFGQIAAALLLILGGLAAGWLVASENKTLSVADWSPMSWPEFARNAVQAHGLYTNQKTRAVEVNAKRKAQLVSWLSSNLGGNVSPPNLNRYGFSLIGGRLLPSDVGAAGQYMYQNKRGSRLTIYISQKEPGRDGRLRYWEAKQGGCYYWYSQDYSVAVTAKVAKASLEKIAQQVRTHFAPQS